MPSGSDNGRAVILISAGGFLSAVLSAALSHGRDDSIAPGIVFGIALSLCVLLSGIADARRAALLIPVSFVAFFFALCAAIGLQIVFPQIVPANEQWSMSVKEPASPVALVISGAVGGLILFGGVFVAIERRRGGGTLVLRLFEGMVLGGVLAGIGWALRSTVGVAVWHVFHSMGVTPFWELSPRQAFGDEMDYSETSRMYSLFVVWQTCIAVALAFMIRGCERDADRQLP